MTSPKNAKRWNTSNKNLPLFEESALLSIKQSNTKCAVSGCKVDNTSKGVALFQLPIQVIFNRHLAIKWRSILSFDQPLTKNTVLCERHFERKYITTSIFTGRPKLNPTAIPSKSLLTSFETHKKEVAIVQPVLKTDQESKKPKKRKLECDHLDDHSSSVPPKKSIKLRFFSENDFENHRGHNIEPPSPRSDSTVSSDEVFTSEDSYSSISSLECKQEPQNYKEECAFTRSPERNRGSLTQIHTPNLSEDGSSTENGRMSNKSCREAENSKSSDSGDTFTVKKEIKDADSVFVAYNDDNASDVFQVDDRCQYPKNKYELFSSCQTSNDSNSKSLDEDKSDKLLGPKKFIIKRVQNTRNEANCMWKIASPTESESISNDSSELEVISDSEIGRPPESTPFINIEPDESSNDSDIIISPSCTYSASHSFHNFIRGFIWDADNIKKPIEAEKLGSSLVDQINKSKRPNVKKVQIVKLKKSSIFYNGKWLRKLKTVKNVKRIRKLKIHRKTDVKKSVDKAIQVEIHRCKCRMEKDVIFEPILRPYF